jgi:acetolactate synthase-1/2/3 large subunit
VAAGFGAAGAPDELLALTARLGAPVAASLNFRCAAGARGVPLVHPLAARPLWREADVVLAVGTRLHAVLTEWERPPGQRLVRIDADARRIAVPQPPDVAVVADAAAALRALLARFDGAAPAPRAWADPDGLNGEVARRLGGMQPHAAYTEALAAALGPDAVVAVDSTQLGYYALFALELAPARTLLSAGAMGTLGSALPIALGARVGAPRPEVVVLCGDGGLMLSVQELATAVQEGLAVTVVVLDDGGYGEVRRAARASGGGQAVGADLVNPDFAALAAAFGLPSLRAESPAELGAAIEHARTLDGPVLVHCPLAIETDLAAVALD